MQYYLYICNILLYNKIKLPMELGRLYIIFIR